MRQTYTHLIRLTSMFRRVPVQTTFVINIPQLSVFAHRNYSYPRHYPASFNTHHHTRGAFYDPEVIFQTKPHICERICIPSTKPRSATYLFKRVTQCSEDVWRLVRWFRHMILVLLAMGLIIRKSNTGGHMHWRYAS